MMPNDNSRAFDIIIIGSGLAGYTFAKEFRKLNSSQSMLIVTADDGHYYSKPALSTGLTKRKSAEDLSIADEKSMATQLNAQLLTFSRVSQINPDGHYILIDQTRYSFQKLVLATGASCNSLEIPGFQAKKVMSINDLSDYRVFREHLKPNQRIAIMGAGLIGCEYANDLLAHDCELTIIEPAKTALHGLAPELAGNALVQGLKEAGTTLYFGDYVTEIMETPGALIVKLASGKELEVDLVLSAVGLIPNVGLASDAGINCERGIIVNRDLETSKKNIYALGDCAQIEGKVMPYVLPLMACSRSLAATLAGNPSTVSFGVMPVITKTPVCPVVVYPPTNDNGSWEFEGDGKNIKGLFRQDDKNIAGFVLTGDYVAEKQALVKQAVPIHTR